MTKDLNNILYNKTKEELTFEDKLYLNKVVETKKFERKDIAIKSSIFSFVNLIWIVPAVIFLLTKNYFPGFVGITTLGSAIVAGGILGFVSLKKSILKSVNLTKQEWKALKKSGRVEELAKMLEGENTHALDKIYSLTNEIEEFKKEDADKSWQEETETKKLINSMIHFDVKERKHYLYCTIKRRTKERRRLIEEMIKNNQLSKTEAEAYLEKVEGTTEPEILITENTSNL